MSHHVQLWELPANRSSIYEPAPSTMKFWSGLVSQKSIHNMSFWRTNSTLLVLLSRTRFTTKAGFLEVYGAIYVYGLREMKSWPCLTALASPFSDPKYIPNPYFSFIPLCDDHDLFIIAIIPLVTGMNNSWKLMKEVSTSGKLKKFHTFLN